MTYQPNMIAAADQFAASANTLLDEGLSKLRNDHAAHGSRGVDVAELAVILAELASRADMVPMLAAAMIRLANRDIASTGRIIDGLRALEHDLRWHNQGEAAGQVAVMIARHAGDAA